MRIYQIVTTAFFSSFYEKQQSTNNISTTSWTRHEPIKCGWYICLNFRYNCATMQNYLHLRKSNWILNLVCLGNGEKNIVILTMAKRVCINKRRRRRVYYEFVESGWQCASRQNKYHEFVNTPIFDNKLHVNGTKKWISQLHRESKHRRN